MVALDYDVLVVEELSLIMSIGIYECEKVQAQRVFVSVEATTFPNKAHESDNIRDALSYEDMIQAITALSQGKHYDLVESFAEDIAVALFMEEQIETLKISVKKPDILDHVKSVGITIFRGRS